MEQGHYLVALGSNMPHHRHGGPERVLLSATAVLEEAGIAVEAVSHVITTRPLGPSRRSYANGAAVIATQFEPPELLETLKRIEREFGRKWGGRRWACRVLDIDIVLWSEGCWASQGLIVPHVLFRQREFVLRPAAEVAPDWRDPVSGLTIRQLLVRLTKPRRVRR